MRSTNSNRDRVARTRSDGIHGVDGVPVTHTPRQATPARKVTPTHHSAAPLPFTDSSPIGAGTAVIAMTVIVLTATVLAVLMVAGDRQDRWLIVALVLAALTIWSFVMAFPALIQGWKSKPKVVYRLRPIDPADPSTGSADRRVPAVEAAIVSPDRWLTQWSNTDQEGER